MGIYLNQDNTMFSKVLDSEIFIDKSMLIHNVNKHVNTNEQHIAISRPRRFGKSMAANMLVAYYSRGCDSRELFSNLKIAKDESFEKHLNKYNVIHLDMQKFMDKTTNSVEMKNLIESEILEELMEENPFLETIKNLDLTKGLNKVFARTKIPFVIIIDEWDCVMRKRSRSNKDVIDYLDFLRTLLKEQDYVGLCYMTGILPIKKYGEHSALNIFNEYTMENQKDLSEFTGFTEEEVFGLCEQYHMNLSEVKKWYDGYNVNGMEIYNPRSVVMSMTDHMYDNYWTKTETYEALKVYIKMNFDSLKNKIEKMLSGEKIVIDTGTFKNDMTSMENADDVLTLLIHLGYLTYDFYTKSCWIPNREVADEFVRCVKSENWTKVMNAINQSEECLKATLEGDADTVARIIEQTHQENTSIIKYNDENALACVVTLSYYTAKNKYFTIRELPTGKGYADIAFIPRKNEDLPAIVVELKKEQSPEIALKQIREKHYFEALQDYSGEVILVGINYSTDNDTGYKKHRCRIERVVK